jgi:glycosyltransferase involved in cell wall biosynthesis
MLVSIISPTFNQQRYVAQCIESALAQTYPNWEQSFVDDGSTDATREAIASYPDPRIRLIALPHCGLGALAESYNAALAVASGSLVGILEGDDAWPADKLERQVPLFDDPGTVLGWGRGALIDAEGRPIRVMTTM